MYVAYSMRPPCRPSHRKPQNRPSSAPGAHPRPAATLRAATQRYSELQRALVAATGGRRITPRVLSRELRQLEAAALITPQVFAVVPPRVEYRMAPRGRQMLGVLRAICRWGTG